MTHKVIKRFQLEGQISDDSDIVRLRQQHINLLVAQMRDEGYVPVLDLDPAVALDFKGMSYDFLITMHGVYYGKAKAKVIYGVAGNREVPMK